MTRLKQDRSRRAKHPHAMNTQDYPAQRHTPQQRAAVLFCNVAALLADSGAYYDNLPPAAQMAVRAVKDAAKLMQGEVQG